MLLILMGLVLIGAFACETRERHQEEAEKEFCRIECRNYSRIYK